MGSACLDEQRGESGATTCSQNDIRPGSFVWRDEASSDGGKTWKPQAEYRMTRRGPAAP